MTCPLCRRWMLATESSCPACGYGLSLDDGVDRVTDNGVVGPLQDFVLRDPRTVRGVGTARSTRGALCIRSRSGGGGALFEFRQESSAVSTTGASGARTRPRVRWRTPPAAAEPKKRPGRFQREATLGLDITTEGFAVSGQRAGTDRNVGALGLLMRRLVAGLVDMMILAGINAAIVYFALRLASLPAVETINLPAGPLLAFLVLFDVGYLVVLTAFGGQTIGKMGAGLPVECGGGEPGTLLKSLVRTAACAVSVLPVGAGFIAMLFRRRRTLQDLIADTCVVRAS